MAHDTDALCVPANLALRIGDETFPIAATEKFGLVIVALIQARKQINAMQTGRLIVQVNTESVELRSEAVHHARFKTVKVA
jgi:hypothetical protein